MELPDCAGRSPAMPVVLTTCTEKPLFRLSKKGKTAFDQYRWISHVGGISFRRSVRRARQVPKPAVLLSGRQEDHAERPPYLRGCARCFALIIPPTHPPRLLQSECVGVISRLFYATTITLLLPPLQLLLLVLPLPRPLTMGLGPKGAAPFQQGTGRKTKNRRRKEDGECWRIEEGGEREKGRGRKNKRRTEEEK